MRLDQIVFPMECKQYGTTKIVEHVFPPVKLSLIGMSNWVHVNLGANCKQFSSAPQVIDEATSLLEKLFFSAGMQIYQSSTLPLFQSFQNCKENRQIGS